MRLTVTGHRPNRLGGYSLPNPVANAVMLKLADSIQRMAPSLVLVGMAQGTDQWAAQICVDLRIPFDAIIPYEGYELTWPRAAQAEFHRLVLKARQAYILSPGPYSPGLLHARNHWMVDNTDQVLAAWNGDPDCGTYATIQYAQSKQKPAFQLDIPPHIWELARDFEVRQERAKATKRRQAEILAQREQQRQEEARRQEEALAQRNTAFLDQLLGAAELRAETPVVQVAPLRTKIAKVPRPSPPRLPPEPEKPPEPIQYRRVIEVGEDDP